MTEAREALLRLRRNRTERTDAVPLADRSRPLPLSSAQQRLWFLDRLAHGRPIYNAPMTLRLTGPLDAAVLGAAITAHVRRHEILRTRYEVRDGVPHQVVDPPPDRVPLPVLDLTGLPGDVAARRTGEAVTDEARTPFDLGTGPVLRTSLVRLAAEEHVLLLTAHHIATDGWSIAVTLGEIAAAYSAALRGLPDPTPDPRIQYADYAAWQRGALTGPRLAEHLDYWTTRLAGLPTMDFPADRPRPVDPTGAGATLELTLPAAVRTAAVEVSRAHRVTVLTTLLAAFHAVLARYTGQDDVVAGTILSGRGNPDVEPLVGFFSTTAVVRVDTSGDPTFAELLARTDEAVVGAHLHQDLPFGQLVEALRPDRDPGRNPLFQLCFTLQQGVNDALTLGEVRAETVPVTVGTSRFDLAVQLTERLDGGYQLWMEYSTELFDDGRMAAFARHYVTALRAFTADPGLRLGRVPLLDEDDRAALLRAGTGPFRPADGRCLHELVGSAARAHPDATAISGDGEEIGYARLDEEAGRLAHVLTGAGAGPESFVGILLERGPGVPISQLAVLMSGAAYLALDPVHPAARIADQLDRAGCRIVVTTRDLADRLPGSVRALCRDDPETVAALRAAPPAGPRVAVDPRSPAYVMFTSGSTGRPKGVVVEHRNVVNFVLSSVAMFGLGPGDRMLQFANPAFDVSVFEVYSALASGATLVTAPRTVLHDPPALGALLAAERITIADIPPSVLALLDGGGFPDLRNLFVGLEPFPGELVNRWNQPFRAFHNGYGPTEATVACIDYECPHTDHDGSPPIGTALDNQTAHVLDARLQPVPVGVSGELYVGGAGVARGYLGQPGLTAERFLPDPFAGDGSRMYRTGDLVRWDNDGRLVFLGRADAQIKIRGLRVEPAEIEHVLRRHRDVRQAAVVVHAPGGAAPRLVAYVAAAPGTAPADAELRAHLGRELPPYMVPSVFHRLDALPLNGSGKLDRDRLPSPDEPPAATGHVAPATATERALAGVWAELLSVDRVGATDNFFALGGNSLQATQLVTRVAERFGTTVDLRTLFAAVDLADLAAAIDRAATAATTTSTTTVTDRGAAVVPLSAGGDRPPLFFVHASSGTVAPYAELARAFAGEHPCLGVEAGPVTARTTVEDMAREHVAAVTAAAPDGPYLLCGWSAGGAVALEVARALRARGAEVPALVLLDCDVPPRMAARPPTEVLLTLFNQDVAGMLGAAAPALSAADLAGAPFEEQRAAVLAGLVAAGITPPELRADVERSASVFTAMVGACAVWDPAPYDGPLALLAAEESAIDPDAQRAAWAALAGAGSFHGRVPGTHYSLLRSPHVRHTAAAIREAITEPAGARPGRAR